MSDDEFSLRAAWMSDPSVSADELMSAVDRVLEKTGSRAPVNDRSASAESSRSRF
jgi:hypothetical protein